VVSPVHHDLPDDIPASACLDAVIIIIIIIIRQLIRRRNMSIKFIKRLLSVACHVIFLSVISCRHWVR